MRTQLTNATKSSTKEDYGDSGINEPEKMAFSFSSMVRYTGSALNKYLHKYIYYHKAFQNQINIYNSILVSIHAHKG